MKSSVYRDRWRELQQGMVLPEELRRLSHQVAAAFMDAHLHNGHYESDYVTLLCEMATFAGAPELNLPAAQALFGRIVEGLCDEFEDLQAETYNRVMAQVICFCRRLPSAQHLHRQLAAFGIHSEADLLARVEHVRRNHRRLSPRDPIRKILMLSRVTVGADVAITSVILQRLRRVYPEAEVVLIGGRGLQEVFGGLSGLRFREVNYQRAGGLLERLETWLEVLEVVESEAQGIPVESTILADPDSRLSQLGIFPLIDVERTLFFDSRSAPPLDTPKALAELCNGWMDSILGEREFCYPMVWLPSAALRHAESVCRRLKADGACKVVTVNFGVGGNRRKRIGRVFEEKLLFALLEEPDTVVFLDQGSGEGEAQQALALLEAARERGFCACRIDFAQAPPPEMRRGLVAVRTRIGEIAALIACSDEYIGYDSAGQHIAAASGTPCVTVFAGSNNRRFIRRWRALGPGRCRIVHVDTLNDPAALDVDDVITRLANERRQADRERSLPPAGSGTPP